MKRDNSLDDLTSAFVCLWKAHISDTLIVSGTSDACFSSMTSDLLVTEIKNALDAAFVDATLSVTLDADSQTMVLIFRCLSQALDGFDATTSSDTVTAQTNICFKTNNKSIKISQIKAAVLNSFTILAAEAAESSESS